MSFTPEQVLEGEARDVPPDEESAIVPVEPVRAMTFTNEEKGLIYKQALRNITEAGQQVTQDEFDYFLAVCAMRRLNPLLREVYLIKDNDGRVNAQTGIDGFRALAEESGQYRGQTPTEYAYDAAGKVAYARVGVYRAGAPEPIYGEAWMAEDKGQGRTWDQRPRTMLAKVAEARALRKAFPRQLSGLYTSDEIEPTAAAGGQGGPQRAIPAESSVPAASAAPGASESAAAQPAGPTAPAAGEFRVPEPVADPDGADYVGAIEKVDPPDAFRRVRADWMPPGEHSKVEVKLKLRRGKISVLLMDQLAEKAAGAALKTGERLAVFGGTLHEREWTPSDSDRAITLRDLRNPTAASVLRDGAWQSLMARSAETPPNSAERAAPAPTAPPAEEAPPLLPPPAPAAPPAAPEAPNALTPVTIQDEHQYDIRGALTVDPMVVEREGSQTVVVLRVATNAGLYRCLAGLDQAAEMLRDRSGAWLFGQGEMVHVTGFGYQGWLAVEEVTAG